MFNAILFNSGLFNQIPEDSHPIQFLDGDAYSGQYSIIDGLQHSDFLPIDVYSGSSAEITYIQHSTTLSLDAYAGEIGKVIDFKTDPCFYHPDANNDFTFFCEYNAPAGEVNFVFPDNPCAAFAYFEAYSGETAKFLELFTADWLPFAYSGEELDLTLLTFKLIPLNEASTGESVSIPTILISKILDPIGYSGENSLFNSLYIPPRAELSIDGYADENTQLDLSASYGLSFNAYGDECGLADLTPTDYGSYILTEGPAAYWKFNEQTGTSATDSTGNNSAATINGPTLANASPVASKFAFYFDGTNDLVTGNPTSVVSANLTQELWVKPAAGATITLYTPSTSGFQGGSGQRYAVYPRQSGSGSGGGISVGSNGIQVVASGNSYCPVLLSYQQPISTTQYTHILVSWNDRTPTLYVNGVAVATGYQARSPFNSQGLPSDGSYGYYKGYMQDVAIYTSALTAAQAREHYLAGIGLHYIPRFEPLPSYSGEYADTDFTIDTTPVGYILNFSGEYTQAFLENNVRFYPDMVSGEYGYINNDYISIAPNSTFTHFHGLNGHSQTSTCLTLNALTSSSQSAGINAYFALPFQLQNDSDITLYFKRTKPSTWYDDDFTDAGLWFCFFPNYTPAQIAFATSSWGYDTPSYSSFKGAIIIRLRFSDSSAILVNYIDASSGTAKSNYLTVNSNWTTTETNGTDECSIVITASGSNTVIQARGKDKVVRQTGTFSDMANPFANGLSETTDTFLIHYHNYQANNSEVLCDMRIGTQEGFVLVPFITLGIAQAYSGENVLVDNLRTVSLFDAPAYSGEAGEWLLSTHPSVDLGIVTNPTGENTYVVLLTSSIIEVPNYSGEASAFSISFFPSAGLGILPGYAGESEYLDLITYAIFRNIDAREGQSANADLTTSPPVLLDPRAYGDENTLFDLSVELAIEVTGRSGENTLFLFDTHPSINLGIVASYTGQRAESLALVTSSVLSLPFYAGENNLLSFTTFPGLEVTLQFIEGETNLVSLATVSLLDGKAYHGQYGTSTLTTFIGSTFTPIFYPGTTADVSLRTIDRLNPIAYSGNNINVTLTDYSAIPLSLSVYSGENVNVAILPGITFPSIAYSGINATLDLYFIVNSGMPAGWYDGESVELSIAATDALPFVGYFGENVLLYFGTSFALYPTAYSGIYAQVSLTLNPFDQIDGAGYNGQIIYPTLNTTSRLPNIGYSGETILFDLHQNLQPNILLVAYDGETLIANLQISFQLPIGRCYSGNIVVVNQIDSEPNIHFYSDSMFGAVISTTDVFKMSEISSGQNCFLGLSVGKSEGIGFLGVYSGTTSLTSFDTVHHASLYVMFRTSIMTQVDIGSATYFDLNTDACCGVRRETTSNNLLMHLFVKDYLPEAISDGDRVVFSLDLRCNPRFSFECITGSTFDFNEYNGYLAMNFANGTECILNQFDADLTNRLCKGYFVPNGNWLVVEMNDVLPEECYADLFYSGTAMSCILSDDIVIRVNNFYNGEHLSPSLTTFPPWLFIFYSGERLWCELSVGFAIYPISRTGENFQFRFYEEPFICYTGASGECEITVDYKVRFKETGCLDNDFTYQNEDGDLIPELSNPIPVEGEPFYHSVLAECY